MKKLVALLFLLPVSMFAQTIYTIGISNNTSFTFTGANIYYYNVATRQDIVLASSTNVVAANGYYQLLFTDPASAPIIVFNIKDGSQNLNVMGSSFDTGFTPGGYPSGDYYMDFYQPSGDNNFLDLQGNDPQPWTVPVPEPSTPSFFLAILISVLLLSGSKSRSIWHSRGRLVQRLSLWSLFGFFGRFGAVAKILNMRRARHTQGFWHGDKAVNEFRLPQ
jgi:hypothetical protein